MFVGSASVDTAPVTGSLHFTAFDYRLANLLAIGLTLYVSRDSTDCLLLGVFRALRIVLRLSSDTRMATGGVTPADAWSGVTFDVQLQIPWNAPEAYIQLDSEGVYDHATVPDVFGRDLGSDSRVFDWGFHDVTIVDMEDVLTPDISDADLSLLRRQWPTSIIESLTWMQSELDSMRQSLRRPAVPFVASGLRMTCTGMWRCFTWTWVSCGVAWCRGAPCGRGRHRTVWTTCAGHMRYRRR